MFTEVQRYSLEKKPFTILYHACQDLCKQLLFAVGIIILTFSLIGCRNVKATSSKGENTRILFVSLKVIKNATGALNFSLLDYVWAEGTLKSDFGIDSKKIINEETLVFEFFNSNEKLSRTYYLKSPLYNDVEFYSEDGKIERKEMSLPSTTFVIRLQLPNDIKYLVIKNFTNDELGQFNLYMQ